MQADEPKGRAAYMALYKSMYPDLEEDPDDDTMFDHARGVVGERDKYKSDFDALNGANERLAEAIVGNSQVAQFVAMIASGEDPISAIGASFGNLLDNLDEDGLKKYREGQEKFYAHYNKIKDNFSQYENTLKKYGEDNGLDEEVLARINDAILDMAEAFNDRVIPVEVIEVVHKGLDYDEGRESEIEAAKLAGKNQAIEEMKEAKSRKPSPLPDLRGGGSQPQPKREYIPKKKNFSEAIMDKEY